MLILVSGSSEVASACSFNWSPRRYGITFLYFVVPTVFSFKSRVVRTKKLKLVPDKDDIIKADLGGQWAQYIILAV